MKTKKFYEDKFKELGALALRDLQEIVSDNYGYMDLEDVIPFEVSFVDDMGMSQMGNLISLECNQNTGFKLQGEFETEYFTTTCDMGNEECVPTQTLIEVVMALLPE
jgi:hypothetical protein